MKKLNLYRFIILCAFLTSISSLAQTQKIFGNLSVTGTEAVNQPVSVGVAGSTTGTLSLSGSGGGTITIQPQNSAGTFNFNLPTTAGAQGAILSSGGGVGSPMTWVSDVAAGSILTSAGATSNPVYSFTPTLGVNGTSTGQLNLATSAGSGQSVTIQNRSTTSAWNFNLPSSAGSAGQVLTSQGGGSNDMTWSAGGGGGGSKNYLSAVTTSNGANTGNGNFEAGSTTGFSLAHSALTSNFPSAVGTAGNSFSSAGGAHGGSAANGNLSLSAVSSNQLAGSWSASYASSAATTAGDMIISNAFNVDTEDQAKVLTIKIYYQAQSGASNDNFSGTSSNSFGIAIYDVTNAAWIMPAGVWCVTQSSGMGYCTGTYQTTSNSTQYQLALFNANASAGATTLYLDDLSVGPQTAPQGPAMTDWVSYTPTSSWVANTTPTGMWRRVGDSMEVSVKATLTGAPTNTGLTFTIPSGYTIDTTKLNGTDTASIALSVAGAKCAGTSRDMAVHYASTTSVQIQYVSGTGNAASGTMTSTLPAAWANGDFVWATFMVPIVGWSSNVTMSSDADTRVVAAMYTGNGAQVITANVTDITFSTVVKDTHGAWNGTQFTVPVTGLYQVMASITPNASTASNVEIYKNGSLYVEGYHSSASTGGLAPIIGFVSASAGDTISLRTTVGITLTNSATNHWVSINRLSGPAVVAATESVNARYFGSSTSISNVLATIVWTTKDYDSHNAMSNGVYTIPVSGKYQVNANLFVAATYGAGNTNVLEIQKNGTVVSRNSAIAGGVQGGISSVTSDIISCVAGDTIRIQYKSPGTSPSINASNFDNYFSISRVGN